MNFSNFVAIGLEEGHVWIPTQAVWLQEPYSQLLHLSSRKHKAVRLGPCVLRAELCPFGIPRKFCG